MRYSAVYTILFAFFLSLHTACGLMTETPEPDVACLPSCGIDQTCTLSEDRLTTRCVDTFTGGGPLEGIESCQWLSECVDACERDEQDSKCAAKCEEQAAEDVQKVHSTWRACVHTNCNAIRSPECLREWCAPQTARCFGDLPGEALTIGMMTCFELAECNQNCSANNASDPECAENCQYHGTKAAQNQWTVLSECAKQHCPDPNTDWQAYTKCAENQCPDAWTTCYGPGPDPPEGTESCGEIHRCAIGCTDSICMQNCEALGTLAARQHYKEFTECTLTRCNPHNKKELDAAMCFPMQCGAAMNRCFDENAAN